MAPKDVLAQPFRLTNGVVIKNRLVKSAMSKTLGDSAGAPTAQLAHLYQAWSEGGVGLCVTGKVMIDRRALGEPGNVVIEDTRDMAALKAWAQAATANGTHGWVQLNHPGKQSRQKDRQNPAGGHRGLPHGRRHGTSHPLRCCRHGGSGARPGAGAGLAQQASFGARPRVLGQTHHGHRQVGNSEDQLVYRTTQAHWQRAGSETPGVRAVGHRQAGQADGLSRQKTLAHQVAGWLTKRGIRQEGSRSARSSSADSRGRRQTK